MTTDLQMLRALLSLAPGKMTARQTTIFQSMFDDLSTGKVISLSKAQRSWVTETWKHHKLDQGLQPPPKKIQVKDKAANTTSSALDQMPKPLRPPGK